MTHSDYLKNFLAWSAAGLAVLLAAAALMGGQALIAALLAYLLSFLFTGSNYFVIRNINIDSNQRFFRIFLISFSLRFLLILAALILVLLTVKIHHIYFTVGFIISYIFHSVTEIIFLQKTLEPENES